MVPNFTCRVEVTLGEKFGGVCATAATAKRSEIKVVNNILKILGRETPRKKTGITGRDGGS